MPLYATEEELEELRRRNAEADVALAEEMGLHASALGETSQGGPRLGAPGGLPAFAGAEAMATAAPATPPFEGAEATAAAARPVTLGTIGRPPPTSIPQLLKSQPVLRAPRPGELPEEGLPNLRSAEQTALFLRNLERQMPPEAPSEPVVEPSVGQRLSEHFAGLYGPGGTETQAVKQGIGGFLSWLQEATSGRPGAAALGLEEEYEALPGPARAAVDVLPLAIATAGAGPLLNVPKIGPLLGSISRSPSFLARLGIEEAVGTAATEAGQEVYERAPGKAKLPLSLLAGLGAGVGAAGAIAAGPRVGATALRGLPTETAEALGRPQLTYPGGRAAAIRDLEELRNALPNASPPRAQEISREIGGIEAYLAEPESRPYLPIRRRQRAVAAETGGVQDTLAQPEADVTASIVPWEGRKYGELRERPADYGEGFAEEGAKRAKRPDVTEMGTRVVTKSGSSYEADGITFGINPKTGRVIVAVEGNRVIEVPKTHLRVSDAPIPEGLQDNARLIMEAAQARQAQPLGAAEMKPTKFIAAGGGDRVAVEYVTGDGHTISRIVTGRNRGKWRTVVGDTEIVGLSPESTAALARESSGTPRVPEAPATPAAAARAADTIRGELATVTNLEVPQAEFSGDAARIAAAHAHEAALRAELRQALKITPPGLTTAEITGIPEAPATPAAAARAGLEQPSVSAAEAAIPPALAEAGPPPATGMVSEATAPEITPSLESYEARIRELQAERARMTEGPPPGGAGRGGEQPPADGQPPAAGRTPDPSEVLDGVIPGEKVSAAILRQYEGRTGRMALEIRQRVAAGYNLLRRAAAGKIIRRPDLPDEDMVALYKALHGEGPVPSRLQAVYDDLKRLVQAETEATVDFEPKFMLHPDYFYRGWRAPKETRAGARRAGATPGFKKPRADATFTEMLEAGWTPTTWNPYDQNALREIAGAEYREQKRAINLLRQTDQAVQVDGPVPEGWRVPRVGPAFEGRAYVRADGTIGYTKPYAVEDSIADLLESMYGTPVSWGKLGPVDIHKFVMAGGNAVKRVKLLGSLFQQVDFAARSGFAAFGGAIDDLAHGHPLSAVTKVIKLPATIGKMAWANVSPARRAALVRQILSDEPIMKERPGVTPRAIADEGWKQTDISILPKDLQATIKDVTANPPAGWKGPLGVVRRRVNQLNSAIQNGLFEGVYPQAQIEALRNFIVPRIVRAHPDWTDAQIAGSAATEVNKMFSTLGNWQTVLANRNLRDFMRAIVFSTNESEALIRQALSTVTGPNKGLWLEFYLGGALFLGLVANTIHFAATGEPLPFDRYQPIRRSKYASLGVEYNPEFLSPEVPIIKGRGGVPINLDLVMQMDTVLRLLDPMAFIKARENVLPRAITSQVAGEDYFGRKLETPGERVAQGLSDIGLPIFGQQAAGILRERFPALRDYVAEGESRLGPGGQAVQISGVNLRGEATRDMLDRWAGDNFAGHRKAGTDEVYPNNVRWLDLAPADRETAKQDTQLQAELTARAVTAVERGQAGAQGQAALEKITTDRLASEGQAAARLASSGDAKAFREQVGNIQAEAAAKRSQADADYKLFQRDKKLPDDPNKRALVEYYNAFDANKLPGGGLDFEALDAALAKLERGWTPAQQRYVEANSGQTEHDPKVQEWYDDKKKIAATRFFDIKDVIAAQYVEEKGGKKGVTYQTLYNSKLREATAEAERRGATGPAIRYEAERLVDKWFRDQNITREITKMRVRVMVRNPEVVGLLLKWGYEAPYERFKDEMKEQRQPAGVR